MFVLYYGIIIKVNSCWWRFFYILKCFITLLLQISNIYKHICAFILDRLKKEHVLVILGQIIDLTTKKI